MIVPRLIGEMVVAVTLTNKNKIQVKFIADDFEDDEVPPLPDSTTNHYFRGLDETRFHEAQIIVKVRQMLNENLPPYQLGITEGSPTWDRWKIIKEFDVELSESEDDSPYD